MEEWLQLLRCFQMTADLQQGDLVFTHGKGIVDWAIRVGEKIRFKRGSKYNHVAMIVGPLEGDDYSVIEAESGGVVFGKLSDLMARGPVYVCPPPPVVRRTKALQFMYAQEGTRYGWLTVVSTVISIILPGSVNFITPSTWICSAVVGEALRYGGWLHNWADVYQVTPAQLYEALND